MLHQMKMKILIKLTNNIKMNILNYGTLYHKRFPYLEIIVNKLLNIFNVRYNNKFSK